MKKAVCLFALFFLTFCKTTSPQKEEDLSETATYQIQITQGYLVKCMYPQALIEVKKALDQHPENYLLYDKVGVVYFLMKEYDLAESFFKKSLALKKNYSEARMNLARTLIEKKKINEALSLVKKTENDLTYTNPEKVYTTLGELYFLKKNKVLTQKYLDSALEMNPRMCLAYYYLGRHYLDQKKNDQAVKNFKLTSKCQIRNEEHKYCGGRNVDFYYYQGIGEIRLGKKKDGAESLKMFLKLAKSDNILVKSAQKLLKEQI